ncbi:MAG: hypothetical protein LBT12_04005 [Oscillospiraceae bacterium]|jgi:hypothetical protein|nr:hypothetical protein [Oscillospiraceae bacterium]
MKKLLALALALTLALSLAACGGNSNGGGSTTTPPANNSTTTPPNGGDTVPSEKPADNTPAGEEWPDNEYTQQAPKPTDPISKYVAPYRYNESTPKRVSFVFQAADATEAQEHMKAYVEQLKSSGFTLDVDVDTDTMYYAFNDSGWSVDVSYTGANTAVSNDANWYLDIISPKS